MFVISFRFFFHCFSSLSHWFHRFVRLCFVFFVTFHRNERDFILIFHPVYLRDWWTTFQIVIFNFGEKKLSVCLCFFSICTVCCSLYRHRNAQTYTHALVHMHMYSSSSSYIRNVEFHLLRVPIPPFPLYSFNVSLSFLSHRCPCLFMTNVCHFYFSHIFSFISSQEVSI